MHSLQLLTFNGGHSSHCNNSNISFITFSMPPPMSLYHPLDRAICMHHDEKLMIYEMNTFNLNHMLDWYIEHNKNERKLEYVNFI